MAYEFNTVDGINEWYVAAVGLAVKEPLRAHLQRDPSATLDTRLSLVYGPTLLGINSTRSHLYRAANIREKLRSAPMSLEDIFREIKGI